jgi:pimeloyl-ACP methyl ester carboxylesterase
MGATLLGSTRQWARYLDVAYPGAKPADWDARMEQITAMLEAPGRMKALQAMGKISPVDAGEQLGNVTCPTLIVQGTLDPDWASPQAEGEAIVAGLPTGLGRLTMIDGAGHYPHVQFPQQTLAAVLPFLAGVRA